MRRKISRFILQSLTISSLLLFPIFGQAQTGKVKETVKKLEEKEDTRFYRGTSVGLEIAGMGSYFIGSDIFNTEVQDRKSVV